MAGYEKGKLPPWPRYHAEHKGKPVCERVADMAVGRVIFQRDENTRVVYERSADGSGRSLERYHYVPVLVTGETRVSWTLDNGAKVKKSEPRWVYGLKDVEEEIWVRVHRWRIEASLGAASFLQLRQIAAIIGYDETRAKE